MIAAAVAFLARHKLAASLGAALAVILLVLGAYAKGRHDEGRKRDLEAALATSRQETVIERATGRANVQAERDRAAVAASTEGLKNADDAVPDERPNAKSRRFDCERLRRAGSDVSRLADCQ